MIPRTNRKSNSFSLTLHVSSTSNTVFANFWLEIHIQIFDSSLDGFALYKYIFYEWSLVPCVRYTTKEKEKKKKQHLFDVLSFLLQCWFCCLNIYFSNGFSPSPISIYICRCFPLNGKTIKTNYSSFLPSDYFHAEFYLWSLYGYLCTELIESINFYV